MLVWDLEPPDLRRRASDRFNGARTRRLARLLNTGNNHAGLGCVEQTLLIPLAARALARRSFSTKLC